MKIEYRWKRTGNKFIQVPVVKQFNPMVLYSLYSKVNNRWVRCSDSSFSESLAYKVYSARLAADPLNLRILPIVIELPKAQAQTKFNGKVLVN